MSDKTTINVSNLAPSIDEPQLRTFFIPFGEIITASLEPGRTGDSVTGKIEYEEPGDAESALDNMQDAELLGRTIDVSWADTRVAFEGLGSKVPLWEQEGFIQRYLIEQEQNGQRDAMQGVEEQGRNQLPVSVGPMPSK